MMRNYRTLVFTAVICTVRVRGSEEFRRISELAVPELRSSKSSLSSKSVRRSSKSEGALTASWEACGRATCGSEGASWPPRAAVTCPRACAPLAGLRHGVRASEELKPGVQDTHQLPSTRISMATVDEVHAVDVDQVNLLKQLLVLGPILEQAMQDVRYGCEPFVERELHNSPSAHALSADTFAQKRPMLTLQVNA